MKIEVELNILQRVWRLKSINSGTKFCPKEDVIDRIIIDGPKSDDVIYDFGEDDHDYYRNRIEVYACNVFATEEAAQAECNRRNNVEKNSE